MEPSEHESSALRGRANLFFNDDESHEYTKENHEKLKDDGEEGDESAADNQHIHKEVEEEDGLYDYDYSKRDKPIKRLKLKGYLIPNIGEKYKDYVDEDMDLAFVQRGEREFFEFQKTINGQLNESTYELIKTNSLTQETLSATALKMDKFRAASRLVFLNRRYGLDEQGNVRDKLRQNRMVCEPVFIYDMIMTWHLINDHGRPRKCHQLLGPMYSNITRFFVERICQFCSVCNPSKETIPFKKYKHINWFKGLLPLERVQVEVFEPFPGEKLGGKYPQILYFRDYRSRFIWMVPLRNSKFGHLVDLISKMIFSMIRIPTVSYTHLDVYKRQVDPIWGFESHTKSLWRTMICYMNHLMELPREFSNLSQKDAIYCHGPFG